MELIVGKLKTYIIFVFALVITTALFPATVTLKLTTTDNSPLKVAGVGHPFLLHIAVQDSTNTAQYPILKNVEKFNVRRTGFQMNMVNNSTSITYTYQVRIDEPGTYTLGPAEITENKGVVTSDSITVTVENEQQYTQTQKRNDSKSKASFLRLTCDKQRVTVGEKISCSLTFYTADPQVTLQNIIEPDQSNLSAFTIKNKTGPVTGNQTINGVDHRYAQWTWHMYANKPTTQVIPAYAADYLTRAHTNMFFLFGNNDIKRVYSNVTNISVDPLPTNALTPSLIGTISQFSAKLEPNNAKVGEGMVLTLSITGDGDFEAIKIIPLSDMPNELKWYESKQYSQVNKADPTQTQHTIEYIVQALKPGNYQIPAQKIFYFDIKERAYKTQKTSELSVAITGAIALPQKTNTTIIEETNNEPTVQIEDEIMPIISEHSWYTTSLRVIPWPLFWILVGIASLLWLIYIVVNSKLFSFKKNIFQLRSAKNHIYNKARKEIKQSYKNNNYGAFYSIFMSLLATHYNIELAVLTPETIEGKLRESGLSTPALQDCKNFYSKIAELSFYKPSDDPFYFAQLYEQSLYWIDCLEKLPKGYSS